VTGFDLADDKHSAQRLFDGVAQPLHHLLGGLVADAEGLRQFRTGQTVSVGEVENVAVAV
jgi:hypothetical protein